MRDFLTIVICIIIAAIVALLASENITTIKGYSSLMAITATGFIIHWLIFIPSFLNRSEKLYDITGTIAYLTMTLIAIISVTNNGESLSLRSKIVSLLIILWALRLGLFLLIRVLQVGEDKRFKYAKKSFIKFLMYFSISGLWVFLTTVNALTVILNNSAIRFDFFMFIGLLIWITGFLFEVIADEQKRQFRKDQNNQNKFISSGLWAISRHPNYFGEIVIWIGMAVISLPVINGWQHITLISPIFVIILLTKVSGINLLEKSSDEKWGKLDSYQNYKSETPILIPFTK